MNSVFSSLRVWGGKWNLKSEQKLDAEDKALFSGAVVREHPEYGKSICFFLKSGGQQYIPMSNFGTQVPAGEEVSLDRMTLQTLSRDGNTDIYRIKID